MAEESIPRRDFLKGAGAAGAAAASALTATTEPTQAQTSAPVQTAASPAPEDAYLTLTAPEAAFLSAAYDTLIPADRLSPSGPIGTIGALTYWSAKAITEQYLKSPGPLVHA